MTLTRYGRREWLAILAIGAMLVAGALVLGWWWAAVALALLTVALLLFFRDPHRTVPTQRNIMVSPADGLVSSIHEVEHFEPFDEPAQCVRIFLSVFDVHINRSPCHGIVTALTHRPGLKMNALNPRSAEANEALLMVLLHPIRRSPVAAVRQVAGMIARTIVCGVEEGAILQRGQRYGMIKFGSTTELYIPRSLQPQVLVRKGQHVTGGETVLASITSTADGGAADVAAPPGADVAEPDAAANRDDARV